ncbi:MAG: hypothetical protein ABI091_25225, partial [Ferruginibacter sp.]
MNDYRLSKNYCKDPIQYTRVISFTPAANKPGELHRINILAIEIGSYLAQHNFSYFKLLRGCKTDCIK